MPDVNALAAPGSPSVLLICLATLLRLAITTQFARVPMVIPWRRADRLGVQQIVVSHNPGVDKFEISGYNLLRAYWYDRVRPGNCYLMFRGANFDINCPTESPLSNREEVCYSAGQKVAWDGILLQVLAPHPRSVLYSVTT